MVMWMKTIEGQEDLVKMMMKKMTKMKIFQVKKFVLVSFWYIMF